MSGERATEKAKEKKICVLPILCSLLYFLVSEWRTPMLKTFDAGLETVDID